MASLIADIETLITKYPVILVAIRVAVILFVGLPVLVGLSRLLRRSVAKRGSAQVAMLVQKGIVYTGVLVALVMVMNELGFDPKAILGAAGIVGVAIGFAAQTSVSNIISGVFLISERSFQVGDLITVGSTTGMVLTVDLLSVKLRTLDNKLVRIPNEMLIKTEMTNITRFPIRRFDMNLGVAYKEDIGRVVEILKDIADKNPYCLDEPEPLVQFVNFGPSELQIFFGVWFAKADFLKVRESIVRTIKERFDEENIEIPFPHRTLYTGSVSEPFPIRLVGGVLPPGEPTPQVAVEIKDAERPS